VSSDSRRHAVTVGKTVIGAGRPVLIAGPCSIESYEQFRETAVFLKGLGITLIRGGAFKPRTSPFSFQGLGAEGLRIMREVCREHGLCGVSEVLDVRALDLVAEHVDMLQIGTRNMMNYALLKEVGKAGRPVLLKRGFMSTIKEWLQAAEYILQDTPDVVLCERGIRTFEDATRNTLDLSAVPLVHKLGNLPVVVDPSHGTGRADIILPMCRAALACGADGLAVEVHPNPAKARSDGDQSLSFPQFRALMANLTPFVEYLAREEASA
jgi:3-deoxy-7-phosphoheptulonate synthase